MLSCEMDWLRLVRLSTTVWLRLTRTSFPVSISTSVISCCIRLYTRALSTESFRLLTRLFHRSSIRFICFWNSIDVFSSCRDILVMLDSTMDLYILASSTYLVYRSIDASNTLRFSSAWSIRMLSSRYIVFNPLYSSNNPLVRLSRASAPSLFKVLLSFPRSIPSSYAILISLPPKTWSILIMS